MGGGNNLLRLKNMELIIENFVEDQISGRDYRESKIGRRTEWGREVGL